MLQVTANQVALCRLWYYLTIVFVELELDPGLYIGAKCYATE